MRNSVLAVSFYAGIYKQLECTESFCIIVFLPEGHRGRTADK